MAEKIAGITIPDSSLAKEATELVRDVATPLVYNHCRRVYIFGALRGERDGLSYDPELLYIGAMFHDLGLTEKYRRDDQRFEIDGADEAREFLKSHDFGDDAADTVWAAIALRTTPEIPLHMGPEIALVTRGVELDVMGMGYDTLSDEEREAIVAAHPRPDFKNGILEAFTDGLKHRPDTTFGNVKADVLQHFLPGYEHDDFVEIIRNSDWAE